MGALVAERVFPAIGDIKETVLVLLLVIHGSHGDAAAETKMIMKHRSKQATVGNT